MRDWRAYVRARLQLPALKGLRDERIVEELAGQLEDLCREAVARGVPASEAERLAIASVTDWEALGGRITDVERANREPAAGRWVEDRAGRLERRGRVGEVLAEALRSVRLSLRSVRREPGFWAVTVGILALGIGATTAIFSVVDGVLLKPLPYRRAEQLVRFERSKGSFALREFVDLAENTTSYSTLSAVWTPSLDWTGGGPPVRFRAAFALPGYMELFDPRVALGRSLQPDDFVGAPHRAVLSWGAWQEYFGGDSSVLGRSLTLDAGLTNVAVEIVGVLDQAYQSPAGLSGQELDLFLATDPQWPLQMVQNPTSYLWQVCGRLRDGIALTSAQVELDAAIQRVSAVHPEMHRGPDGAVLPVSVVSFQASVAGPARLALRLLSGAVGLLLLIACANVANLLLARGVERQHEIAMRSAMGAGRLRIVIQVLSESLLFALTGCAGGLLLALAGVRGFELWNPGTVPFIEQVGVDGRVLLFAVAVSLLTGLVFGAAPAIQAHRLNVAETLKDGARSGEGSARGRVRRALVAAEIATAVVLLAGAGLVFNSFVRLTAVEPGFEPAHLAGVGLRLGRDRYDGQRRAQFVRQLLPRITQMPGVRSAAVSMSVPFEHVGGMAGWHQSRFVNDLGDEVEQQVLMQPVTSGFFATVGASLRGEDFSASAPTEVPIPSVVSESFARRLFGARDPVGRVFRAFQDRTELRVIGVVPELHHYGLAADAPLTLYIPWELAGFPEASLAVRTSGDPAAILPGLRAAIWELDPNMPLPRVFTVPQLMARSVATPKFHSALLLSFATVALVLAAGGTYGSMLYSVGRRRHELGVRAALGADRARLMRMVLWSSARVAAVGLALGIAGALAAGRALRSLLFSVTPGDPLTLVAVALVMGAAALAASLVPAWRAARADPLEAMRAE